MSNRYDIIENASPRSKMKFEKTSKKLKKLLTNRKQRAKIQNVAADEATTQNLENLRLNSM